MARWTKKLKSVFILLSKNPYCKLWKAKIRKALEKLRSFSKCDLPKHGPKQVNTCCNISDRVLSLLKGLK